MQNPRLPSSGIDWPDDLRVWVDEADLVRFTFEAVHAVESSPRRGQPRDVLTSGTPRVLLTLLTYSYVIGVLDAEEIQRQVQVNVPLRYLAARSTPAAGQIREFRRQHLDWLQGSLCTLFQRVWEFHAAHSDTNWSIRPTDYPAIFESAAHERIERALLADSMALDI